MIDAMRYTKDLMRSGFSKDQADTSLKVFEEIMNNNFATKKDIQLSELALRSDMKEMELGIRSDMKEEFSNIRSEMKEVESSIRSDMKEEFSNIRSEIKDVRGEIRDLRFELKADINKVVSRMSAVLITVIGLAATLQKVL